MATTALMTAAELEALPEDDQGELIRGVRQPVSPPNLDHFFTAGRFISSLDAFVRPRDLGIVGPEAGFLLEQDPDTVLAPDVAFVPWDRLPTGEWQGFQPVVPAIAVEVLSPWNTPKQVATKVDIYLAAGVALVLVADPKRRTTDVYAPGQPKRVLTASDVLDGGDVLPGFSIPVADLFRPQLPSRE